MKELENIEKVERSSYEVIATASSSAAAAVVRQKQTQIINYGFSSKVKTVFVSSKFH